LPVVLDLLIKARWSFSRIWLFEGVFIRSSTLILRGVLLKADYDVARSYSFSRVARLVLDTRLGGDCIELNRSPFLLATIY
jgi:hypothetical protein